MNNTDFLEIVENITERAKVGLDLSKFNRFAEIDAEAWLERFEAPDVFGEAVEMRLPSDENESISGRKPLRPVEIKREAVRK